MWNTFQALDEYLTRKASCWSDIDLIPQHLEELLRGDLAALPRATIPNNIHPTDADLSKDIGVTRWLVYVQDGSKVGGQYYYVDTQGSDYARYALRLRRDPPAANHLQEQQSIKREAQAAIISTVEREIGYLEDDLAEDARDKRLSKVIAEMKRELLRTRKMFGC